MPKENAPENPTPGSGSSSKPTSGKVEQIQSDTHTKAHKAVDKVGGIAEQTNKDVRKATGK